MKSVKATTGLTTKSLKEYEQVKRDRQALIDLIRTGMVQKLEDFSEPRLSREAREAVRILTKERYKKLEGIAMRVPRSGARPRFFDEK